MTVDEMIVKVALKLLKKSKEGFPGLADFEEEGVSRSKLRYYFGGVSQLLTYMAEEYPKEYEACQEVIRKNSKLMECAARYTDLVVRLNRYPTLKETLVELDMAKSSFHSTCRNLGHLTSVAKSNYPEYFEELFSSEFFTPRRFEDQKKLISKYKRFAITTAVSGCRVENKALDAMKNWCDHNGALPLFTPIADPARPRSGNEMFFDRDLQDEIFIYDKLWLNKSVYISDILISAKQINPTTGLRRIGPKKGACIFAAPKQIRESVHTQGEYPKFLLTPGAITESDYKTDMYMSNRTADLADHDHEIGFLVVEIEDEKKFHVRHVKVDPESGELIDLGWKYDHKGNIKWAGVDGMVLPDLHLWEQPEYTKTAWGRAINLFQPPKIVVHDSWNGSSTDHHERKKTHTQARKFKNQEKPSVYQECDHYIAELEWYRSQGPKNCKIVKVLSNHDVWFVNWIEDGHHVFEPRNYDAGHVAALEAHRRGEDPLKSLCRERGMDFKTIDWLQIDESYIIGGLECGYHGHCGPGGSRGGGIEGFNTALGPCVIGHTHKSRQKNGSYNVGTSTGTSVTDATRKKPEYAKGPLDWDNSILLIYPKSKNGHINAQLVSLVEGELFSDQRKWEKENK
jgi:hypothetical protein